MVLVGMQERVRPSVGESLHFSYINKFQWSRRPTSDPRPKPLQTVQPMSGKPLETTSAPARGDGLLNRHRQNGLKVRDPIKRPYNRRTGKLPLKKVDLFVNDFVAMAQEGDKQQVSKVRCTLLHTLDKVLRELDTLDDEHRQEPALTKKLKQGNTCWGTRKLVLAWIINTILLNLELPQQLKDRLQSILDEIPRSQKRISTKKWQQVVG
jgi:hypothetical protein